MADTGQGVGWALSQSCRVRNSENWKNPLVTLRQVANLRCYSSLESSGDKRYGIFDGIGVTGYTAAGPPDARSWLPYPTSGFIVASRFDDTSGVVPLKEMCGNCAANSGADALAGCAG